MVTLPIACGVDGTVQPWDRRYADLEKDNLSLSLQPYLRLVNRGVNLDIFSPSNPIYIAHRGSALMYPENTTEAYTNAVNVGIIPIEQDVWTLSDGTLGVMHDSTVDRVTTSTGNVTSFNATTWAALDIDSNTWFRANFGNDLVPPTLPPILSTFKGRAIFVVEAKDAASATPIVTALQAAGIPTNQAIVQAFQLASLAPAVAAGYPAMYLAGVSDADIAAAQAAGVTWVGLGISATNTVITNWISAGFKVVCYTLNRRWRRDELLALGVTGFFSDDARYLSTNLPLATQDNFGSGRWQEGMIAFDDATTATQRGVFLAPDYWGKSLPSAGTNTALMGWASPINGNISANNFTIDFKVLYTSAAGGDASRWVSVFLSKSDKGFADGTAPTAAEQGYHTLFRKDGRIQIFQRSTSAVTLLQTYTGAAIADGAEIAFRIVATPTSFAAHRLDSNGNIIGSATQADATTTYRGGVMHLGHNGITAYFRDISIT